VRTGWKGREVADGGRTEVKSVVCILLFDEPPRRTFILPQSIDLPYRHSKQLVHKPGLDKEVPLGQRGQVLGISWVVGGYEYGAVSKSYLVA